MSFAQSGDALLFMVTIPVLAALFLGRNGGWITLILVMLTLTAFAVTYIFGYLSPPSELATNLNSWTARITLFLMVSLALVLPQSHLFKFLVAALCQRSQAQASLQKLNRELDQRVKERTTELQTALDNIKTLKGMIPICVNCKKVHEDKTFWQDVEIYVSEHSEAKFSHGVCPDCMQELYPEQYEILEKRKQDILAALTELGQADLSEIASVIGVSENIALNRLRNMEEAGEVKRIEENEESFFRLP
jgi:C4-dicarboxylate-specific signal transduction histidine kinase